MNTPQSTGRGPPFLTAPTCHRALLPSPRGDGAALPPPSEGSRENGGDLPAAPGCLPLRTAATRAPPTGLLAGLAAKVSAPLCSGPQAESRGRSQGRAGSPGPRPCPATYLRPESSRGLWALLAPLRASPSGGASAGPGRGKNRLVEGEHREEGKSPPGRRRGKGEAGAGSSQSRPGTLSSSAPRSLWPEAETGFLESKGRAGERGTDA